MGRIVAEIEAWCRREKGPGSWRYAPPALSPRGPPGRIDLADPARRPRAGQVQPRPSPLRARPEGTSGTSTRAHDGSRRDVKVEHGAAIRTRDVQHLTVGRSHNRGGESTAPASGSGGASLSGSAAPPRAASINATRSPGPTREKDEKCMIVQPPREGSQGGSIEDQSRVFGEFPNPCESLRNGWPGRSILANTAVQTHPIEVREAVAAVHPCGDTAVA